MDWGRIFKQAGKGMAGRTAGAVVGQVMIPIPGVGAAVGAFIGGWAATGKITSGIVGLGFLGDAFGVAGDVVTSATSDVVSSAAGDVGGSLAGSAADVSSGYVDASAGFITASPAVTSHADLADGVLNGQGNPNDMTIHGGRPTDIQGNPVGRTIQGGVPSDVWGRPTNG